MPSRPSLLPVRCQSPQPASRRSQQRRPLARMRRLLPPCLPRRGPARARPLQRPRRGRRGRRASRFNSWRPLSGHSRLLPPRRTRRRHAPRHRLPQGRPRLPQSCSRRNLPTRTLVPPPRLPAWLPNATFPAPQSRCSGASALPPRRPPAGWLICSRPPPARAT